MSRAKRPSRVKPAGKAARGSEIAAGVFVGGWNDAIHFRGTRICVLDEPPAGDLPAEAQIPIYDEGNDRPLRENLDRVVRLVEAGRAKDEPVLLFCGHGVRRGPLAGAWYLHVHDGVSLDDAYRIVQAARPKAQHVKEWVGQWKILEGA